MRTFTPIFDDVVSEYGLQIAAVYGSIWRYCQLKDGVCSATIENIASYAGLKPRATIKHIKTLIDGGLIQDLTPGRRYRTHKYSLHEMQTSLHEMQTQFARNAHKDTKDTKKKHKFSSNGELVKDKVSR